MLNIESAFPDQDAQYIARGAGRRAKSRSCFFNVHGEQGDVQGERRKRSNVDGDLEKGHVFFGFGSFRFFPETG